MLSTPLGSHCATAFQKMETTVLVREVGKSSAFSAGPYQTPEFNIELCENLAARPVLPPFLIECTGYKIVKSLPPDRQIKVYESCHHVLPVVSM
jgi:hypothetical protein